MNLPSSFSPKFLCLFQIFYTLTYFFSHLSLHMRRTLPQDRRPGTSADVPDVPSRTSVLASYASVGMKMLLPCKHSLIQAYVHVTLPSCILCIFIQSFFHSCAQDSESDIKTFLVSKNRVCLSVGWSTGQSICILLRSGQRRDGKQLILFLQICFSLSPKNNNHFS